MAFSRQFKRFSGITLAVAGLKMFSGDAGRNILAPSSYLIRGRYLNSDDLATIAKDERCNCQPVWLDN